MSVQSPDPVEFDVNSYPESVWYQIFLRCEKRTLSSAEKSCHLFNNIICGRVWFEKCRLDGVSVPPVEWRKHTKDIAAQPGSVVKSDKNFDYKRIYYRSPFNRNLCYKLTKNTTLESLAADHNITFHHGGDGIRLDSDIAPQLSPSNDLIETCFLTSYEWCNKYYEINLEVAGIEPWILDHIRPTITIREMYCNRRDCSAVYKFYSQLLLDDESFDRNVILPRFKSFEKHWAQWEGGQNWEAVEHVYSDYPIGIRKIGIFSAGKDEQYWAGFYGSRFTNTEIIVDFPEDIRYKTEDEFADPPKQFVPAQPRRGFIMPFGGGDWIDWDLNRP